MFKSFIHAMGFLTRLPLPGSWFGTEHEPVSRHVSIFPLAGALIGVVIALPLVLEPMLTAFTVAVLSVIVRASLTGFLHDDGLADCADAFWGGRTIERRLEIMKDSRIGTYGATVLCLALVLEVALVTSLLSSASILPAMIAIVLAAALSRWAIVLHWRALAFARPDGLAATSGRPEPGAGTIATLCAFGVSLCTLPWLGPLPVLTAIGAAALAAHFTSKMAEEKLGGLTGDTLGATERLAHLAALVAVSATLS